MSLSRVSKSVGVSLCLGVGLVCSIASVQAATISVTPSSSSYSVGQLFTVPIYVSAGTGESLNAVAATVTYPASSLQLVSVDKSGSIINFWVTEPSANTTGQVHFEGGVYNPGYSGTRGKVASLVFKAKAVVSSAKVAFSDASILANDGMGTNILTSTIPGSLTVTAAPIVPEQPVQNIPTSVVPIQTPVASSTEAQTQLLPKTILPPVTEPVYNFPNRLIVPVLNYLLVSVVLASVVLLALLWIWYLVHRVHSYRRKIKGDIKHAGQSVHVEFKRLLDAARIKRKLTAEEERILSIVRDNIHEAEEVIEEEIRKIGQ